MVELGSGNFTYSVVEQWESLPEGYWWRDAAAVAVDSKDRVFVFNRGNHPMILFDKDGGFLGSWGEGLFTNAHAITLGPDDTIYCVDDGDHTVRQCTLDGRVLMTIGIPGRHAEPYSGDPFNRCTDVAVDPNTGDLYVSDGYANARVHKYSPAGRLLFSWGGPGTDPGQFNIPHNIATDRDGYVYVADRESHRVQIFDSSGRFETQWNNLHRPCAIFISDDQIVYIGELGWGLNVNRAHPNLGPRITVMNTRGERLGRIGHLGCGLGPGQFVAPHGIGIDSDGSIYVGEVAWTNLNNLEGRDPGRVRSLQKLVRAH